MCVLRSLPRYRCSSLFSPLQYLKNTPNTNKYEGWPELLELEGCVPRKVF